MNFKRCSTVWSGPISLAVVLATAVFAADVSAAVIAGWDFNGLTTGGPSPLAASTVDSAVTAGGLARRFGGVQANAGANTWGSNVLTAQTKANAIQFESFFSFSVTAQTAGVSLSDIGAYNVWIHEQDPASSPANNFFGAWQYRTGSNAFADIGSSFQLGSVSQGAGNMQSSVSLAGLPDLQVMPAGTVADFRFVVWGAGYGANYAGFNSFQSGNDLVVSGTVIVPEPSAWILAFGGLMCGCITTRHRVLRAVGGQQR